MHNPLQNPFRFFVGMDWGSQRHRLCLLNQEGAVVEERWIEPSGSGLADLLSWLHSQTSDCAG